jgi:hypothetical protein
MKMKKQFNLRNGKQLMLFLVIMSFVVAGLAQKSVITMKEDNNIRYLKDLAAVISNLETNYSGYFAKPVASDDISAVEDNLVSEEYVIVSDYSAGAEEEIKVEDWMLDEAYFRAESSNELYEVTEEKSIAIEDWMMDESHFLSISENELYEVAEEEKLVIEDWMLDESHFLTITDRIENENTTEDELTVENWMLDPGHWVLGAE